MNRKDPNEHREVERSLHPVALDRTDEPDVAGHLAERVHPESAPASTESIAEQITRVSPEGRPASPRVGYRTTIALVAGVVIVALGVTGVVGYFVSPWPALAMLVVGGLCLTVFNPVVWAAAFRAKDNEDGAKRATYNAKHQH